MLNRNPDEHLEEIEYIEEDIQEDFSYLDDDDDVYEEYFSPNGEIEIDEDEEVEIIETVSIPPPPPFAFAQQRFGNVPPPPFPVPPIQEIEIEEIETDEFDLEYDDQDELAGEVLEDVTRTTSETEKHRQTYAQMNSAQASAMVSAGAEQSVLISRENTMSRVRTFFKILLGLGIFAGLCGLCYMFIHWNHTQISKKGEMDLAEYQRQNIGWRLPESISNDIIKRFFESLGSISAVSELSDMLIKGKITMNGKVEEFYCIRRANGMAYIKIGTVEEGGERAYFVAGRDGVSKLIDMRVSARKVQLQGKEALALQSLVFFDEQMFKWAFLTDMRAINENVESFKFAGRRNVDSQEADVLSTNRDGNTYTYAFSSKTGELLTTTITSPNDEVVVKYSDYKEDDGGVKIPFVREIFLNGKPIAKVDSRIVIRNKGFIFP